MEDKNICALRQSISKIENSSDVSASNNKNQQHNLGKATNDCFRRIVVLTNYRERCCEELRQRLVVREKFDRSVFDEALARAKKYDLVDDERYAEMYAFCKTQSCRGTLGVVQHLRRMKIDYESMPRVMETLAQAKACEEENAKGYIAVHSSSSKDPFAGNVRKLVNRGYSVDVALKAAKNL